MFNKQLSYIIFRRSIFVVIILLLSLNIACFGEKASKRESFADVSTIEIMTASEKEDYHVHTDILEHKDRIDVSIGVYHSLSGGLLFLADGLGFFSESGLNVTIKLYGDYKGLVEGFKNNEIDVATIGLYESMLLALDKKDFVGVVPLIWRKIYFMLSKFNYVNDIKNKVGREITSKGREIVSWEEKDGILTLIYKANGKEKTLTIDLMERIHNIKNLKNNVIGLDVDSIAYYILHNHLINEGGMVIEEVISAPIPDTQLIDEINKGLTDVGAFSEFNKIDEESGGVVVFDSSRYKTHTVESLLCDRNFAKNHGDAIIRLIDGWKKAVVFFEEEKAKAINVMTNRGRLNFRKDKLNKALEGDSPIIPTINNGDELRESYFNIAGNYTIEAIQLLDFITKNYDKYNNIEYQSEAQKIKNNLEKGYYFDITYLETVGFKKPELPKNITIDESNWNENKQFIPTDYSGINWNDIYPKMVYAPKAILIKVFEDKITAKLPEIKDKYQQTTLQKFNTLKNTIANPNNESIIFMNKLEDAGYTDFENIGSVTDEQYNNEIFPLLFKRKLNLVFNNYKKMRYHYVKRDGILDSVDDEIIDTFNMIGYNNMSELESTSYNEDIEGFANVSVIGKNNAISWGFKYKANLNGRFRPID